MIRNFTPHGVTIYRDDSPGVLVAEALPERGDLLFPVDLVRDDGGQIIGCRALGQV